MTDTQRNNKLQDAADAARKARAFHRIAKAASLGGAEGAAIAALEEAAPFLIKLIAGLMIAAVLIPMLVFTGMPNMFFGFDGSETAEVMDMTRKAMAVGGAYISLKTFENTQVDAVVTGIVNEYENEGYEIDHVVVHSSFDEADLLWMIAINSVAFEQDLNTMTVESIWNLSYSSLEKRYRLGIFGEADTTLEISFEKFDPEVTMEELGFDEEAREWAKALHDIMEKSDALHKYGSYYKPMAISYSGDTSTAYGGPIDHGGSYNNEIDNSRFINPYYKNNHDLAVFATQAWENNWGYVWGTFGNVLTSSLLYYKIEQYPEGVGNFEGFIRENWLGRRTVDCVGLIKAYGWYNPDTGMMDYASNGMSDLGADQMFYAASESGSIDTIPEIEGLAVWKSGHIGVYIGGGYVIEAMGTMYGVVRTELTGRGWEGWCKIPFISYNQ